MEKSFTIKKILTKFNNLEIEHIRKKKISLIFQNNNLITDLSVIENVMLPLLIRNENLIKTLEKSKKILSLVKLSNRCNFFPNDLSGGEQQRVAIARSLIAETDIILADEPTGNLDYKTSKEIFNYLLKLKKMNKTILFATHNRELANKADYKLSISNGNIKRLMGKNEKQFTNFKIHSQYSICEGALKIEDLADIVKKNKNKSNWNMLIAIIYVERLEFAEKISKVGTQPIIGTQINLLLKISLANFQLYATTEKGYKNLTKLSSLSYLESADVIRSVLQN